MEWTRMERNTPGCQWVTPIIGRIYNFHVFGTQLKKVTMWTTLGAWGFDEGFGKRCGVESITGFIGLGADLKKGL